MINYHNNSSIKFIAAIYLLTSAILLLLLKLPWVSSMYFTFKFSEYGINFLARWYVMLVKNLLAITIIL